MVMGDEDYLKLYENTKKLILNRVVRPAKEFLTVDLIGSLTVGLGSTVPGVDPLLHLYAIFLFFVLSCCLALYPLIGGGIILSILGVPATILRYKEGSRNVRSALMRILMFLKMAIGSILLLLALLFLLLALYFMTRIFLWAVEEFIRLLSTY